MPDCDMAPRIERTWAGHDFLLLGWLFVPVWVWDWLRRRRN